MLADYNPAAPPPFLRQEITQKAGIDLLLCPPHPAIAPQDPRPTSGWDVHALLCGAYREAVMQAKLPAADQYADGVEKHPLTVSDHDLLLGFLAIARQFMSGIERDINQMVQTGNLSRLRQWTQNNIADNAVFNRTNSIETEGQSRAVASMTITTTWTCWSILALRPAI
jgi:hypothetical protein